MEPKTFLTSEEVAELTGIRTGRRIAGKTISREQLQINQLRQMGIPFYENARGRPIVTRATIEGKPAPVAPTERGRWMPRVVTAR